MLLLQLQTLSLRPYHLSNWFRGKPLLQHSTQPQQQEHKFNHNIPVFLPVCRHGLDEGELHDYEFFLNAEGRKEERWLPTSPPVSPYMLRYRENACYKFPHPNVSLLNTFFD